MLAGMIALSLSACGGSTVVTGAQSQDAAAPVSQAAEVMQQPSSAKSTEIAEETAAIDSDNSADTLVLYFSAANTRDADAISSATPMDNGVASTQWIAELIHEEVGGDLAKIVPAVDYPLEYNDLADVAKKETDSGARPAFEPLDVDPTTYKTVFLGYPIWWYTVPMIVEQLFDSYDFSGVTIIPFNTHAGSRNGGTYALIQEREPDAAVLEGLAIRGEDVGKDSAKESIIQWLQGLNLG